MRHLAMVVGCLAAILMVVPAAESKTSGKASAKGNPSEYNFYHLQASKRRPVNCTLYQRSVRSTYKVIDTFRYQGRRYPKWVGKWVDRIRFHQIKRSVFTSWRITSGTCATNRQGVPQNPQLGQAVRVTERSGVKLRLAPACPDGYVRDDKTGKCTHYTVTYKDRPPSDCPTSSDPAYTYRCTGPEPAI